MASKVKANLPASAAPWGRYVDTALAEAQRTAKNLQTTVSGLNTTLSSLTKQNKELARLVHELSIQETWALGGPGENVTITGPGWFEQAFSENIDIRALHRTGSTGRVNGQVIFRVDVETVNGGDWAGDCFVTVRTTITPVGDDDPELVHDVEQYWRLASGQDRQFFVPITGFKVNLDPGTEYNVETRRIISFMSDLADDPTTPLTISTGWTAGFLSLRNEI